MPERVGRPSHSITAVAIALLLWSLAILAGGIWYVKAVYAYAGSTTQVLLYWHDTSTAIFELLVIAQISFGLAGAVIAIGLLRLRVRARKAAIFLSTVPVSIVAFALLIFAGGGNGHGASSMTAASGFITYGCFFIILLPLSIWWLVVLTRAKVRSQFH